MAVNKVAILREMMWRKGDFNALCDGINGLSKLADRGDADAVRALAEFAKAGEPPHARTHAMAGLAKCAGGAARHLSAFFREMLDDPATRYWALESYATTAGPDSYATLVEFASNSRGKLEERAQAVKCLARSSGQPFDRGLPADPGQWKIDDLRLAEIQSWCSAGFPRGGGYTAPIQDPALDKPTTRLEKAAASLERKLQKLRIQRQDLACPSNWLTPADPRMVETLIRRLRLAGDYVEFLRRFSPLRVMLTKGHANLWFFGAEELVRAQDGYSFNPVTKEIIEDWPDDYVVVAAKDGDPFVLDETGRVLTAPHGEGEWAFREYAGSFVEFLEKLAK